MTRLKLSALAAGVALLGGGAVLLNGLPSPARASAMTVYKSESCGCCAGWVEHMRQAGYTISVVATEDPAPVKARHAIPQALWGCHTGVVNGKIIEGHVPAAAVAAFLKTPAPRRASPCPECRSDRPAWRRPATHQSRMMSSRSAPTGPRGS
jgi:hypothetical protein